MVVLGVVVTDDKNKLRIGGEVLPKNQINLNSI